MKKKLSAFFANIRDEFNILIDVDIDEYIKKIIKKAYIIYYTNENQIEALSAFYVNNPEQSFGYITFIGKKISCKISGKTILENTISIMKLKGFKYCQLEVDKQNIKAKKFYLENGFTINEELNNSYILIKQW